MMTFHLGGYGSRLYFNYGIVDGRPSVAEGNVQVVHVSRVFDERLWPVYCQCK